MNISLKQLPRLGIVAVISVIVAVIACVTLFAANHWRVEFSVPSGETDTIECMTEYTPPEVTAVLKGDLFLRRGKAMAVTTEGAVDTGTPGEYRLVWAARFAWFSGKCERTVMVTDTTPPVITLVPEEREYVLPGEAYVDPGFSAADAVDGDLTAQVQRVEDGSRVTYTVSDRAGNVATAERTIPYYDPVPPQITLKGESAIAFTVGSGSFTEPGYTATDNLDGDLTDHVTVQGSVDSNTPGIYTVTYSVTDSHGNTATKKRRVTVRSNQPQSASAQQSGDKVIYLTFDDGPGPYTGKLLDILKKYNVKATFFVTGSGDSSLIAREAAEGHTVAIHSMTHNYKKIYASEEAYFADLQAMNEVIKAQTGAYSTLLRFPGGSSNKVSSFNKGIMTRLTRAVHEAGYEYYDWNVSSGDAGETTSTDQVYRNVINGVKGRSSSVVLQHDIKNFSVNAVERIIQWGLENGYTFLPLTRGSPTAHHGLNN